MMKEHKDVRIAIIGLGYVGLPLAVEFGKKYPVVGYDILEEKVENLKQGKDTTFAIQEDELQSVLLNALSNKKKGFFPTTELQDIKDCNVYIVTVPTPIDEYKKPDLTPLKNASTMLGTILTPNDVVIYESTTFPGCTEEICVPILEKESGLAYNTDFFVGYSPERINVGDTVNTLTKIVKVTSGSTLEALNFIDDLYNSILENGTHKAPSIKVAEASKVIENAQRDVNISFINELAIIFEKLNIDTQDVLQAAATKWNFLPYKPGLVGGHCISVDPYYLAYKAEQEGYIPSVILSGRRVNEGMGKFIAHKVVKLMVSKEIKIKNAQVLILGITFKENCSDLRNTKVIDMYNELQDFGCNITIYDPWANPEEVKNEYNIDILTQEASLEYRKFDAIVLAVGHQQFLALDITQYAQPHSVVYDCKAIIDRNLTDARL